MKKDIEDFSFIGWFGEDTEEWEDYEEGNYDKENPGRRKTDPDDEDWAYRYDYD